MTGYLTRDRAAVAAAVIAPLVAAAVLLPFRSSWPNTNVALLVVVVVAVAAIGNRPAGAVAAMGAAAWFDFFFTLPYERFTIRSSADVTTFVLLLVVGVVVSQLAGLLDLQECHFEYGVLLGHPPRLEPDGTVRVGRGRWDVETLALPGQELELRVVGSGLYFGRFMMRPRPGSRPSLQARLVAVTLADQVGRALAAGAPVSSAR